VPPPGQAQNTTGHWRNAGSHCYEPCCRPDENGIVISLQPEEIELIRLVDLEGLEQDEATLRLGVSRKTAWQDLHEARRKIADALVLGKEIEIAGCRKQQRDGAPNAGVMATAERCIPGTPPV
jgi:uncharacterized protein